MSTYIDGLILGVIRPKISPAGAYSLQPADLLSLMPCIVAKHLPGGAAVDSRFRPARVIVQVDAYHASKRAAFTLADAARSALIDAWRSGRTYTDGRIVSARDLPIPAELRLPGQADGFTRYTATYPLTVA